jgi:hypothetical protein
MSRFSQLAQTAYNYNYTTTPTTSAGDIMRIYLYALPFAVLEYVGLWKTFTKAGRPGWAAIIPIYNLWVLFEITGKPGWWSLLIVPMLIPFVGYVIAIIFLVLYILALIELAKRFGKSAAFALLLILLPFIGFPMLGFGSATYRGGNDGASFTPNTPNGPTPPQTPPTTPAQSAVPTQPASPTDPTPPVPPAPQV